MGDAKLDTKVLDALIANLDGNMTDAVTKAALMVEQRAKLRAPVQTGALRASIYVSMRRSSNGVAAMNNARLRRPGVKTQALPTPSNDFTAFVGPSVEYGAEVELGAARRAGTPYLQPALRETERDIRDLLARAVKNGK